MSITPPKIDSSTGASVGIDYGHHELHDGDVFRFGALISALANNASVDIIIDTPDTTKWAHWGSETISTCECQIQLFEGATYTGGTGQTCYNKNRNSAKTATVIVKTGASITGTGTAIMEKQFGSGKTQGADAGTAQEWILKQKTTYLFRITNKGGSGSSMNGSYRFLWYEHSNLA